MVLVQSNSERTHAHHFDAACAWYGAMDNCMDVRLTSFEEVQSGRLNGLLRQNLAVGSTDFMREVFRQLGKGEIRLPRNSNRKSEIITLLEAKTRADAGEKLFIKPLELKIFTGLVLDGMKYTILNDLPDDTKVFAYQPFSRKLESEWRVYVHHNKMVDARNYSGDYCLMFNPYYVEQVIQENKADFPDAYTIDIGVFMGDPENSTWSHSNENAVVEFNDMWAIGNYGIPNDIYLRLLKDRYFQILRNG